MYNWLFVSFLGTILTPLFIWSFKHLPRERWQIICAVPVRKMDDGTWQGHNVTYYGLFNALAVCSAVALVLLLIGACGMDVKVCTLIVIITLGCCLPASRWIARWVEKRPNTFSVGAASFTGIVLGPWIVWSIGALSNRWAGIPIDAMAVMAAMMVGYAMGEGVGRLACISFGCCYGRPMHQMPPRVQRYFSWAVFTYSGSTKKIAYAHQLDEEKIFAVQAFTAVFYCTSALVGTLLVLNGAHAWAYFSGLIITQGWRFLSEFVRSDYRGDRTISVYQIMSLLTLPYGLIVLFIFPSSAFSADLPAGFSVLWDPGVILLLQAIGIIMFLRTGVSQATGSSLSFHVCDHRIAPHSQDNVISLHSSSDSNVLGNHTPSPRTDP
jgi:hypothetical protein